MPVGEVVGQREAAAGGRGGGDVGEGSLPVQWVGVDASGELDAGSGGAAGDLVAAGWVGGEEEVLVSGQRLGSWSMTVRWWLAWRPAV